MTSRDLLLGPLLLLGLAFGSAGAQSTPTLPAQARPEDRVDELEKQLRVTQDYMFTEFGKLSKGTEKKGGGRPEMSPVLNSLKATRLRLLIKAKYSYTEEGLNSSSKVVPPVSSYGISNARLYLDGEISDQAGYVFKTEFANKGNAVQLQEAYGTYKLVKDSVVLALGQRQPKTTGNGPTEYWPFTDPVNSSDTLKWSQNDRGLGVSGRLFKDKFFYEAQMMHGNGIDTTLASNDNYEFLYSLLTRYEPQGKISPWQNDIEYSPFLQGFSLLAARSRDKKSGLYRQDKVWYSGAYYLKWSGLYGKAMFATQNVDKEAGAARDQYLWTVHLGYAIKTRGGNTIEPMARYEDLDYNLDRPSTREKRAAFGVNYYLAGQKARFTLDYSIRREKGASSIDNDIFNAAYVLFF